MQVKGGVAVSEDMMPQSSPAPDQKPKRRRPRAGKHTRFVTQAAMIAAIYAALAYACAILTQGTVRIGEAMMILPFFTPAAIPGLFIGYFIGYFLTGQIWDAVFGGLGALIAAAMVYLLGRYMKRRRLARFLASFPPIIMTSLIMPFVLYFQLSGAKETYFLVLAMCLSGETITCLGVGQIFFSVLERYKKHLFYEYK